MNLNSPTRLPFTNQVTLWGPGMFEVISLTYSSPRTASWEGAQMCLPVGKWTHTE